MQVVVLSPHRDDAAFSCGLLLHALCASGATVRIVNICTISEYAPYLAAAPEGGHRERVTTVRRGEDEAFAALLAPASPASAGPGVHDLGWHDLGWHDAPVRWAVGTEAVLAASPVCEDERRRLQAELAPFLDADIVLAPLAIGGHVDHRLVRAAAAAATPADKLLFYEDLPYGCRVADHDGLADASASIPGAVARLLPGRSAPGSKHRYALCYPSQIAPEVADEMEAHAAALGGRERFFGEAATLDRLTQWPAAREGAHA